MFGQGSARFRTTDFFGIVLPGAYLVCQVGLLGMLFILPAGSADNIASKLGSLWAPLLVLLLFVSYLIGSVFRTWSVDDTDRMCAALFPDYSDEAEKETEFPYRERLRRGKDAVCMAMSKGDFEFVFRQHPSGKTGDQLTVEQKEEALRDYLPPFGLARSSSERWKYGGTVTENEQGRPAGTPEKFDDVEPWAGEVGLLRRGTHVHNFWKAILCVNSPSGFEFAEATEARSRFFFGMLWAARWSLRLMFFVSTVLSLWSGLTTCRANDWRFGTGAGLSLTAGVLGLALLVVAIFAVVVELWAVRGQPHLPNPVVKQAWPEQLTQAIGSAETLVREVLRHPSWDEVRCARKALADLISLRKELQPDTPAQDSAVPGEQNKGYPRVIADNLKQQLEKVEKELKKVGDTTEHQPGTARKAIKSLRELSDELKTDRKRVVPHRAAFWVAMLLEVLLTPAFFIWTMAQKYADIPQRRVVLLLLLASSATLLFIFLARRLRRVRAREMRAVYLNYVALVLASYRTEGKGGKSS
jgi:hypothetical protein